MNRVRSVHGLTSRTGFCGYLTLNKVQYELRNLTCRRDRPLLMVVPYNWEMTKDLYLSPLLEIQIEETGTIRVFPNSKTYMNVDLDTLAKMAIDKWGE